MPLPFRLVAVYLTLSLPSATRGGEPEHRTPQQPPVGKSILELVKQLRHQDTEVRVAAAAALADLGPKAAGAVPALVEGLHALNEDVRLNAALALAAVGKPAVPALVKALGSPENEVRFYAALALGQIGPAARESAPALVRVLADPDEDVRRKAAGALGEVGGQAEEVVPALVKLFHEDPDVADAAAEAAGRFGKAAAPALLKALEDPKTRHSALRALTSLGADARSALPLLRRLLAEESHNPDESERLHSGLGAFLAEDPSELARWLKHRHPSYRWRIVAVLKHVGPKAIPLLCTAARDPSPPVRGLAVQALGDHALTDQSAYDALVAALCDEDNRVRDWAYYANWDKWVKLDTRSITEEALQKARGRERILLAGLLAREHDGPAIDQLNRELKNNDLSLRLAAAQALAHAGKGGRQLLPLLAQGLKHPDTKVRAASAASLEGFTGDTGDAVPMLLNVLHDPEQDVREAALRALQGLIRHLARSGKPIPEIAPAVARLLGDADGEVRGWAVSVLRYAGKPGVAPLIRALKDQYRHNRRSAVNALESFGAVAKEAVPALVELARDGDLWPDVVRAVQQIDLAKGFPPLLEALSARDAVVRQALADMGKTAGKPTEVAGALLKRLRGHGKQFDRALHALREMAPFLPGEALEEMQEEWVTGLTEAVAISGKALAQADARTRQAAVVRLGRLWELAKTLDEHPEVWYGLHLVFLNALVEATSEHQGPEVRWLARRLFRVTSSDDSATRELIERVGSARER
ncbi:MAG: HEAT repeat domain-containing protein [Gemmataceae bacterium]|nr:HEAT repeat domain-containing protein [Gemmataceae bacterium]